MYIYIYIRIHIYIYIYIYNNCHLDPLRAGDDAIVVAVQHVEDGVRRPGGYHSIICICWGYKVYYMISYHSISYPVTVNCTILVGACALDCRPGAPRLFIVCRY